MIGARHTEARQSTAWSWKCSPVGSVVACLAGRRKEIVEHTLSSKLADIVLPDADGREVRLGSLWASQSAVLVFLRHYG